MKNDNNFRMVIQALYQNNTLSSASLIGATHKPMGLGFVYHIYLRLSTGAIVKAEAYV